MKSFLIIVLLLSPLSGYSQINDSLTKPIISAEKIELLNNIDITFDLRTEFQAYTFRGGDRYYNGMQFENGFTALGFAAKLHERVNFRFRNRFNRGSDIQSLDQLGSNIELAYVDIKASPKLNVLIGKTYAFYGGYEYEFSALNVLEYNDIQSNALAYVTGAGITYQPEEDHKFGFQILNSRTMLYDDIYGDEVAENIEEPIWPVAVVGNWRGNFFDGKFQTIYSLSYSNQVKSRGTYFFTLGNKYQNDNLTLMYDFNYSYEEIDTKGIVTDIFDTGSVAQDAIYIENWMRAEYQFSPKFRGLLSLMTSNAYGKENEDRNRLRTSYGMVPTLYYSPFKDFNLKFFLAYIGRFYNYTPYAEDQFNAADYNRNEVRVGIIAPLLLL
ncbi:porin [Christiangramia forsetii]|uniref:Phosphate-selective porin O and P n=2 Tax=Christiangramia forsetii TaxID=411153 RepID=A0M2Q3_CHRFK|nr:porin [Christiangramia forsetii]GGG44298.1 hypothetical protein GCM10011532_30380 [Christiangramia forsetii]CAL66898.1 conserved hypothetical protein, secreted [Christiangramia forsetii KT0803]